MEAIKGGVTLNTVQNQLNWSFYSDPIYSDPIYSDLLITK